MFSESLLLNKNTKHSIHDFCENRTDLQARRRCERQGRWGNASDNREVVMIRTMRAFAATTALVASCLIGAAPAEAKQLTLCWAAWDPANALVELGKDFTAKTG